MMISGERTERLHIFCRISDFTSDFLSFIDVELILFFHEALQLLPLANQHLSSHFPGGPGLPGTITVIVVNLFIWFHATDLLWYVSLD